MSERTGADAGPSVTLRAGLRRWFLRPPRPHGEVIEDRRVSFLELFYDLVYVVLIGQLAHTLAEDISWSGVLDFAVDFGWSGSAGSTAPSFTNSRRAGVAPIRAATGARALPPQRRVPLAPPGR